MEFIQVPETPAPEPQEPDVPDCCGEEKIGESNQIELNKETQENFFLQNDG